MTYPGLIKMDNLFSVKYPIILAPMAGNIVGPEFIAFICNNGMLGTIPGGYIDIATLKEFITQTKKLTNMPIGVNVFIEPFRSQAESLQKSNQIIDIENELHIEINNYFITPQSVTESDYIDLCIQEKVSFVSCTFGFFNKESVSKLKTNQIKIIGSACSLEEYEHCVTHGADAVVLQGTEAGGHQASFLTHEKNTTPLIDLLGKIQSPEVPLIAAGGISPDNMAQFFKAGASYIQLGSIFLMTNESNVATEVKDFMEKTQETQLCCDITGKWARGVKNTLMERLANSEVYAYPLQHYATSNFRKKSKELRDPRYQSLWAGSNHTNLKRRSVKDVIASLQGKYELINKDS